MPVSLHNVVIGIAAGVTGVLLYNICLMMTVLDVYCTRYMYLQ